MPRRSTVTRLGRVLAATLLGVLTLAPLAGTGYAMEPDAGTGTGETSPTDAPSPERITPTPLPSRDATPTDTPAPSTSGPSPRGRTGPGRVLVPPGPPSTGIDLQVGDVVLDTDTTVPAQLVIRLTNTGGRAATGVLDLVVPAGVSVTELPTACRDQRQVDASTAECGLGSVPVGVQRALAIPLTISEQARASAPLVGLVHAALTASGHGTRTAQAPYRITAPQVRTSVSASPAVPRPAGDALTTVKDPAAQPIIFGSALLLALVTLGLIVGVRGRELPGLGRRKVSAAATTGPWRPVSTFAPPLPRDQPDPPIPTDGEPAPADAERAGETENTPFVAPKTPPHVPGDVGS